jgi:hypothetical protein
MNVIFLDIDGVLNSRKFFQEANEWIVQADTRFEYYARQIDPECVQRLNNLVERTGSVVVLSSTWRRVHPLDYNRAFLRAAGFRGVLYDETPVLNRHPRGDEIEQWLLGRDADRVDRFVILDDDCDMADMAPWHVRTSGETGLVDEDCERAERMVMP